MKQILSHVIALLRFLIQWQTTLVQCQMSKRVRLSLELKPADAWFGFFPAIKGDTWHVWVIVIPCLPLHFEFGGAQ